MSVAATGPKYQQVYTSLRRDIESGRLKRGDRVPSEAELVRTFGASRITVGRAVRELQRAGLVERRVGSGTYVKGAQKIARALSFGLLIPDLGETEIFEPICQGMMASPLAREHALVWGPSSPSTGSGQTPSTSRVRAERAWQLCRHYIDRKVAGVFFAPLELMPEKDDVNLRIADALDAARIPIVLLDRTVVPYPRRGHHDLVGIDNRRAGYVITDYVIGAGSKRVAFLGMPHTAATVDAREAGYREALYASGLAVDRALARRLDPTDTEAIKEFIRAVDPDGIVCANDHTAARVMRTLLRLGRRIPEDITMVGIDDAEYAELLPVPLTTLRQPTAQIGHAALAAMLDRISQPSLPPRDILLHCEIVERESCRRHDS